MARLLKKGRLTFLGWTVSFLTALLAIAVIGYVQTADERIVHTAMVQQFKR